jgi:hypothetical protein
MDLTGDPWLICIVIGLLFVVGALGYIAGRQGE